MRIAILLLAWVLDGCESTGGPAAADASADAAGGACGMPAQPCCPGNACLNGCCTERRTCVAAGARCVSDLASSGYLGTCEAGGSCGECGGLGQGVCGRSLQFCTQSHTTPGGLSGSCVACGRSGEPCCRDGLNAQPPVSCLPGLTCAGPAAQSRCQ
jgi:hypothetical protein